jgi:hypothetical protein
MSKLARSFLYIFTVYSLTACGIAPIHFDGNSATFRHHSMDFESAMKQSSALCKNGDKKGIKHESTSCARDLMCVSTFNCISN